MAESANPTYAELRQLLLDIDASDDDVFAPQKSLDSLMRAGMLERRPSGVLDVTALGGEVADRLRAGGDSPELRRVCA